MQPHPGQAIRFQKISPGWPRFRPFPWPS